jgi:hypothetical protein
MDCLQFLRHRVSDKRYEPVGLMFVTGSHGSVKVKISVFHYA